MPTTQVERKPNFVVIAGPSVVGKSKTAEIIARSLEYSRIEVDDEVQNLPESSFPPFYNPQFPPSPNSEICRLVMKAGYE